MNSKLVGNKLRTYRESYRQKLMLWSDGKSFILSKGFVCFGHNGDVFGPREIMRENDS